MELTSTDAKEVVEGKKSELKPGVGNDDVTEEEVKAMAELKKALVGAGLEDRFTERELWPFLFGTFLHTVSDADRHAAQPASWTFRARWSASRTTWLRWPSIRSTRAS